MPDDPAGEPAGPADWRQGAGRLWLGISSLVFFSGCLGAAIAVFLIQLYGTLIPGGSAVALAGAALAVGAAIMLQAALRMVAAQMADRLAQKLQHQAMMADGESGATRILPLLKALRGRAALAAADLGWVPAFLMVGAYIHPAIALTSIIWAILTLRFGTSPDDGDRRQRDAQARRIDRMRRMGIATLRDVAQVTLLALGGWLAMRGAIHMGELVAATMLNMRALSAVQAYAEERPMIRAARKVWQRED